jgi:hypothetical protein
LNHISLVSGIPFRFSEDQSRSRVRTQLGDSLLRVDVIQASEQRRLEWVHFIG